MTFQDEIVYGERIRDILPGLLAFRDAATHDEDGRVLSSVTLENDVAQPLVRALMRVEAELLLEDADEFGSATARDRTPPQRSADALVRLTVNIGQVARSADALRSTPP